MAYTSIASFLIFGIKIPNFKILNFSFISSVLFLCFLKLTPHSMHLTLPSLPSLLSPFPLIPVVLLLHECLPYRPLSHLWKSFVGHDRPTADHLSLLAAEAAPLWLGGVLLVVLSFTPSPILSLFPISFSLYLSLALLFLLSFLIYFSIFFTFLCWSCFFSSPSSHTLLCLFSSTRPSSHTRCQSCPRQRHPFSAISALLVWCDRCWRWRCGCSAVWTCCGRSAHSRTKDHRGFSGERHRCRTHNSTGDGVVRTPLGSVVV